VVVEDKRRGNFNYGNVRDQIYNEAPPAPEVKWGSPVVTKVGNSYRTDYNLEVVSHSPVNAIWFEVYGENVRDLLSHKGRECTWRGGAECVTPILLQRFMKPMADISCE